MADIYVYGPIGDSWDPEAMTAAEFARQLRAAGDEDVTVHVNSAGGDVFDANAMAELVRAREGRVTAVIEGLAASAASYFALTADEVLKLSPGRILKLVSSIFERILISSAPRVSSKFHCPVHPTA